MSFITDHHESPAVTFAEPGATRSLGQVALDTLQGIGQAVSDPYVNPKPYGDLFWAAERSTRLTGNVVSESASREEAYDRRIKAIKAATGLDLENPERGGYQIDARRQIAQEVRAGGMTSVDTAGGIPEYQRRIFDQKVAELQKGRPDLSFGDLDTEARQIAHGSSVDLAKAAAVPASGPASLAVQFAGGVLGSRRDPIFIGSMLAGPETAAARTVFGRVAGAAMRSGLYNAGISAMEQPAVQAWREKIGLEHGIVPAIEDVGFAFGLGLIPGAVVQGIKEGFRAPMGRVLAGHPEPGDIAAVKAALPIPEREAAALKAGEESVAADRATLTIQPPKGVPEPLHDDMLAAAMKRADQPDAPSPEAVEAVKRVETEPGTAPAEVEQRITEAAPKTEAEAHAIADQALDDIGRREGMGSLRDRMGEAEAERVATAPQTFKTAKGSTYQLHEDGTTTRDKAARTDAGHEGDSGPKPRTERTVYVDDARLASALSAAGIENLGSKGARVIIKDGKASLLTWNEEAQRWGRSPSATDIPISEAPQVGKAPLELWKKTDDVPGHEAYRGMHAGNAITEMGPAPARARGDVLDKVPWVDDAGNPKLMTAKGAAAVGERETTLSMLVRSCK